MLALNKYNGINLVNCTKRSRIDGIGQLTRVLFATAIDEAVVELPEKFNQLTSFANVQEKLIHINSRNIDSLELQVHGIASYTYILRSSLNDMLTDNKSL